MRVAIYDRIGGNENLNLGVLQVSGEYAVPFYRAGDFTITVNASSAYAENLQIGNLLYIDNRVWGVILNRKVSRSVAKSVVTVTGKDVRCLFENRVIVPSDLADADAPAGYSACKGYTGELMQYYVSESMQGNRDLPWVYVSPRPSQIGNADDAYYSRFEILADVLEKIGRRARVGYQLTRLYGNTRQFNFLPQAGYDRTKTHAEMPPVVFDVVNGTLLSFEYIEEQEQAANTFYCTRSGAEFEDEALTQTYYLDGEDVHGIDRVERHLNVSVSTEEETFAAMEETARKDMENYRPVRSISAAVSRKLTPFFDYDVGDTVIFRSAADGIEANVQIEAIRVAEQGDSRSYTLTLGDPVFTRIDLLRRDIKNR